MKNMKWMKKMTAAALALVMGCALSGCQSGSDQNKTDSEDASKITVVLDWTPNTNHTGLYVAEEKGYFEDAGLNVEIQEPPEDGATVLVASGKAQFGYDFQEYLAPAFQPGQEMGITAVAAIIQHNTSGLLSLKEKEIESPADLEGHTYATWDMDIEKAILKHLMEKDSGDYSKLKMIPSTVNDVPTALKTNQVDTVWVYYAWDGIATKVQGMETNFINFGELDSNLDFYSPVLVANNDYLEEHPKEAKAFLAALKKGYEFAIDNPDEAADILCKEVPELDQEIVKESQEWLADQYQGDADSWGVFDEDRWNHFYKWLKDEQVIDYEIAEGTGFSNDYLQ